jgi:hypothetical protein
MDRPDPNNPYQIIVEGSDDLSFFIAFQNRMLQAREILQCAFIKEMQDKDQNREHRKHLLALSLSPVPVRAIGIIRDADENPDIEFAKVQGIVRSVDRLPIPTQIGTFQHNANFRVGILILPHDHSGTRETLCLEAVAKQPVLPCIDSFLTCIKVIGDAPYSEDKARLLAYLAAQKETSGRIGNAIEKGYIPWNSPTFEIIRRFLRDLNAPFE